LKTEWRRVRDSEFRFVLKTGNLLICEDSQNSKNAEIAVFTYVIHTKSGNSLPAENR